MWKLIEVFTNNKWKLSNHCKLCGSQRNMNYSIENVPASQLLSSSVDKSAFVLICYSTEYLNSSRCRVEAQNAHKKKKPLLFILAEKNFTPDGWLGVLTVKKI